MNNKMSKEEQKYYDNLYSQEYILGRDGLPITRKNAVTKDIRKDSNAIGFALICFFIGSLIVGVIIAIAGVMIYGPYGVVSTTDEIYYLMSATLSVICIGVPFAVFINIKRVDLNSYFKFEPLNGSSFLYVIAGWGLCLAVNIPVGFFSDFMGDFGVDTDAQAMPEAQTAFVFLLKIFAVAVIPAFFEEFAFRGVMLTQLRKYGTGFALFVSSLAFGLIHGHIIIIPFAFLAGYVMGMIYVKTGNLWLSIIVHFLNNFYSVLVEELVNHFPSDTVIIISNFVFFFIIFLGLVFLALLDRKQKITGKMQNDIEFVGFGSKFSAFIFNPCMVLFIILCTITIIIASVPAV